ncbi:MAG: NAD(P)-binding domain-containing protein [Alphaproteobacteria bacterium]|nr:NAD(P)-binding domain-containing protein [Alphaproteobacteria bacterium]
MTGTIGFIGAGHLAGFLVEGLRRGGFEGRIVLSPRNAERAAGLAARFDATVARSNQEVADQAETLFLTVRPALAAAVLHELKLSAEHDVISCCAGIKRATLAAVAGPARVVRAMPISCAALCESPTPLFPDDTRARAVLERLGTVIAVPDEASFETASVNAALYGWFVALFGWMADANQAAGLPDAVARELVLGTARGAASVALADPQRPLSDILQGLATPGGITAQGLDLLTEAKVSEAWSQAFAAVHQRLTAES